MTVTSSMVGEAVERPWETHDHPHVAGRPSTYGWRRSQHDHVYYSLCVHSQDSDGSRGCADYTLWMTAVWLFTQSLLAEDHEC